MTRSAFTGSKGNNTNPLLAPEVINANRTITAFLKKFFDKVTRVKTKILFILRVRIWTEKHVFYYFNL